MVSIFILFLLLKIIKNSRYYIIVKGIKIVYPRTTLTDEISFFLFSEALKLKGSKKEDTNEKVNIDDEDEEDEGSESDLEGSADQPLDF